jgi:microcompartment protein CcmL/EutN
MKISLPLQEENMMKPGFAAVIFCGALAAPAYAIDAATAQCPNDATTAGMHARMKVVREQMDRIEWTTDRAEQRRLMDLNMKHVQEGLREIRRRPMAVGCKVEMMDTMLETVVRQQQVALEAGSR